MKLYFLRHGESEYNVKDMININPKMYIPMTKKGFAEAERAARKLKKIKFDAIYVSEFLRARQTAEIVNKHYGLKLNVDSRLNEINVGFESKLNKEFLKAAGKDLFYFKGTGSEDWQDLKKRVRNFLDELKNKDFENVLIVSHQWVIRVANQIVNGLSDEEAYAVPLGNCGIIVLEI